MRLSASALKEYTKCGYAFKLKRIDEIQEPGKKSYGMLNGRVIGNALSAGSMILNRDKGFSFDFLALTLSNAYLEEFQKAGIPLAICDKIHDLLLSGMDPDLMMELYVLSHSINTSEFELKIPALLKSGALPNNTKQPTFGHIILKGFEDLQWFFGERNLHYNDIRDATEIEHERYFSIDIGNEHRIDGYFDQSLVLPNGRMVVSEFKSDKTAYSVEGSQKMVQMVTYKLAVGQDVEFRLFDISHQRWFIINPSDTILEGTRERFRGAIKSLENHIYTPACGMDPYNDKRILCNFKGSCHCPFGSSDGESEMND